MRSPAERRLNEWEWTGGKTMREQRRMINMIKRSRKDTESSMKVKE